MKHETVDVHHLRRLWKPHKERLLAIREDHATPIRFHRACSWLSRVEASDEDELDFADRCRAVPSKFEVDRESIFGIAHPAVSPGIGSVG